MVLYVMKWNVLADKVEAYTKWTGSAIQQSLSVPGVVEFRGYRPATGAFQVVVTYEFADLDTWAAWYAHENVQKTFDELHTLATNVSMEVWGPSPIVPKPIRPGQ